MIFPKSDYTVVTVLNPGKGVCADPGKRDATLGVGGPGPPERGSEQQLDPDSGGGKTLQDDRGHRRRPHHDFKRQLCTE
jgi:hypothetical protein